MPRTVVCFKSVATEADLRIDPVTRAVDASRTHPKISDYDRNTIEAARIAAGQLAGELVGLTFGRADARAAVKDALARGLDRAVHILAGATTADGTDRADGHVTARVLAAQIGRLDDVGLVLCTEGASDTYAHETGPRLGELLGWPVVTNVRDLVIDGDRLRAVRVLGADAETVECELPAVVTVVPEIAPAPIPGLRSVLLAGKKPTEQVAVADLDLSADARTARTTVTSFLGFVAQRRRVLLDDGDAEHRVAALVRGLTQDGVL
ncbi:electron transfer flavoprotein subunit beta/FixA family protein [Pengzhenrongella phosphoraccumulans]|uniref:electron transfer flavoprotein subunit beta/FixA family protein n=1 Tax=Pengzhenrongella phosphoraccumulans TaxID=3114394 RepID=UPI00388D85AC